MPKPFNSQNQETVPQLLLVRGRKAPKPTCAKETNMPEIATLTRVPLREVWRHEALDFTKWLVDNISVVSEATGVELPNAESEHSVGAFSVDLIAETLSGDPVIIETQLEKSDPEHLGVMTTLLRDTTHRGLPPE